MAAKKRIYWTDEENEVVIAAAIEHYLKTDEFIWQCIKKAQPALPQNRRKSIIGKGGVNRKLHEMFKEALMNELTQGFSQPIVLQPQTKIVEKPKEEIISEIPTTELLSELSRRLGPILDNLTKPPAVNERMKKTLVDSETGEEFHQTKTKVLVCEFLPPQIEAIKKKATNLDLDLVFRKKDDPRETSVLAEYCVTMVKTSHSAFNNLKKRFGNDRVIVVKGVTEAMKALADINSKR